MTAPLSSDVERNAFRTLNAFVEPLVRAGLGGPLLTPFGLVVLEVPGRNSGLVRRTPLLAATLGSTTIVSTFRGRQSAWVKNLAAATHAAWWVNGRRREGHATVFAPGLREPEAAILPTTLHPCIEAWKPLIAAGWAVAILAAASEPRTK